MEGPTWDIVQDTYVSKEAELIGGSPLDLDFHLGVESKYGPYEHN